MERFFMKSMTTKVLFISLLFSAKIFLAAEMEEPQHLLIMTGLRENKNREYFESLLKNGTNPREKDENGVSALITAINNGRSDVVELLLNAITNLNETDQKVDGFFKADGTEEETQSSFEGKVDPWQLYEY